VSAGLHLGELDSARVKDLSPILFAVAAAGDPVARGVVAQQADEVIALATVAARRLGLLDKTFTAVLGGGVLAAQHPLLHDAVVAGVHAAALKVTIRFGAQSSVAGAALVAPDGFRRPEPGAGEQGRGAGR